MVLPTLAMRAWRGSDARLLWKLGYNFGYKGMRSVQRFKKRLKHGQVFPPFLYISIINSCNLRCTGCWVDVAAPQEKMSLYDMNRLVTNAKEHGNSFFGILGGEPFMHPELLDLLAAHPDCYFQIFTNGHFLTPQTAARLRRLGNATILISVEGSKTVSDERRGGKDVLNKTLRGLRTAVEHKLITGVATSVCRTNFDDLVSESWIDRLIELGVLYCWFHTYRAVGPDPSPDLALTPEQVVAVRRFAVEMRNLKPIAVVDAYWDDKGQALCPAVTGISHHISPWGDIEPCPVIQFANETIRDNDGDLFKTMTQSALLSDFRQTVAGATRGCVVLEQPALLKQILQRNGAHDTTVRQTALPELEAMFPLNSQHNPDHEIPEKHWLYRLAKKHWFFGFGAYS
ncbi:MAG: radical SAM protein [Acidobacteria bacterium]|nr:MAG: radical SAM protein [Acidobacteriota bacterium]TDI46018.1 MAG: radical SAM protein [Acidobacteriota bacterium]